MMLAALLLAAALATGEGAAAPAPDPIMVYDGAWTVRLGDGTVAHLVNHCMQGTLFVACEQTVDGKVQALLTFRRVKVAGGLREYVASPLNADGAPADGSPLVIEGDRWTYSFDTRVAGKKAQGRVVNLFTGRDHIHFEIQSSDDGKAWTTTSSGDEVREAKP